MMGGHLQRAPKKAAPKPPVLAEYLSNTPLNTEVLALPEAEQVIRGLNSGNITVEQLVQQLANPALAQRQRDLILSVLKLRSLGARGQGLPPPMPQQLPRVSPVAQQADPLMLLPQGVPGPAARVSPLMFPPAPPQRLPRAPGRPRAQPTGDDHADPAHHAASPHQTQAGGAEGELPAAAGRRAAGGQPPGGALPSHQGGSAPRLVTWSPDHSPPGHQ